MSKTMHDLDQAPFDAVAFDLDGTLVDSAPDIGHALNSALSKAGLQRFDLDTVKSWIGDGPDALIDRALAAQGMTGAQCGAVHGRLRRAFDVSTLASPLNYGRVYDGVVDLLSALSTRLPLVVVTNKPSPLARAVLASAQLSRFVTLVQGADTSEMRKPAPTMLLSLSRRLKCPPDKLLMVGDSAADMDAAAAAGCAAGWAAWGYGRAPKAIAGAEQPARLEHPREVLPLLHLQRVAAA